MKVYLDNAATTPIDKEVLEAMLPVMEKNYGNPSSIHAHGREVRAIVEECRKKVASLMNCSPSEIFFTSGGTEADNMAIRCCVNDLKIRHAISSEIEHHAVLHTLEELQKKGQIELHFVRLLDNGHIDIDHLEELLKQYPGSFVSLMHANNELGNMLDIDRVGALCLEHKAIFHCDTVQTVGHFPIDLSKNNVHFITCAAHKFNGPKGAGFIYINRNLKIKPLITGGAQERNMRGGTENVYGIVGLAKALEIAYRDLDKKKEYISSLKKYMKERLIKEIPGVKFNGDANGHSLYTVLNVCLPKGKAAEMMLFRLDIEGISASGGSACSSGSDVGSHVLKAIGADHERPNIRFSFGKYNTKEEIDYTIEKLKSILD